MWSCIVQLSFIYIVNEYLNVDTGVGRVSIVIFMMQVGTLVFFIVRQFFFKNTCSSKKQIFTQGPLPIKLENLLVKSLDKTAPFFHGQDNIFLNYLSSKKASARIGPITYKKHKIYQQNHQIKLTLFLNAQDNIFQNHLSSTRASAHSGPITYKKT